MEFGLNEQEKMLQRGARDFAAKSIRPHAGEIDKQNRFPVEIVAEMAVLGYKGLPFPAAYGGGEIRIDDELIRKDGVFVHPSFAGLNPENLVAKK